jgi:hypothetical protein
VNELRRESRFGLMESGEFTSAVRNDSEYFGVLNSGFFDVEG